jgi:hypothetical protein
VSFDPVGLAGHELVVDVVVDEVGDVRGGGGHGGILS